jgi:hypothetical protein
MIWKKYGLIFGAAAIMILMTARVTAVNVDSNIQLPRSYLPKLNYAFKSTYNVEGFEDIRELLKGIINLLQDFEKPKKVVNSVDIQKIIEDNDLTISGIYGPNRIIGWGPGYNGPHIIRWYWGGFMWWKAQQSADPWGSIKVTIGSDTYTNDHNGLVVGFFGSAFDSWGWDTSRGFYYNFGIYNYAYSDSGFGLLIFVS